MSADFNTFIKAKGSLEDLLPIIRVLKKYENDSDIYINYIKIGKYSKNGFGKESRYLQDLSSDEEIKGFLSEVGSELCIEGSGPYGKFGWLEEVGLFEAMSEASPDSEFSGNMSGFSAGGKQEVWCELKDKKLHLYYKYTDDENDPYCTYVMEKMPYDQFIDIFKIDPDSFEELDYYDWIDEMMAEGTLFETSYDDFQDESIAADIGIDADEYELALEKVKKMGIMSRDEFEENDVPDLEKIYDPIEKKYL